MEIACFLCIHDLDGLVEDTLPLFKFCAIVLLLVPVEGFRYVFEQAGPRLNPTILEKPKQSMMVSYRSRTSNWKALKKTSLLVMCCAAIRFEKPPYLLCIRKLNRAFGKHHTSSQNQTSCSTNTPPITLKYNFSIVRNLGEA